MTRHQFAACVAILAAAILSGVWCGAGAQECPGDFAPTVFGSVGYGANTRGGDPAQTVQVTNGNDAGAGSLRAALVSSSSGKTITFAAAVDTILLTSEISPIGLSHCTINGFSSPDSTPIIRLRVDGDNSTETGDPNAAAMEWKGSNGCHDIIIAGLRFWYSDDDNFIRFEEGFYNGIVSHCSFGPNDAEQLAIIDSPPGSPLPGFDYKPRNITLQYNLFNPSTGNADNEGAYSVVIINAPDVTMWRNASYGNDRSPRAHTSNMLLQFVNNVIGAWGSDAGVRIGSSDGSADIIANTFVPDAGSDLADAVLIHADADSVYRADNDFQSGSSGDPPTTDTPQTVPFVPTATAAASLIEVLAYAGCPVSTDGTFDRDVFDQASITAITGDLE